MRLILLGPPGAGKGTQAEIISENFKVFHVSTGQLLREAVRKSTKIGKEAENYMKRGELVPDEIVINILISKLKEDNIGQNFILDGFPRTENQAIGLDKELKSFGKPIELVLYFNTSDEVAIQRLSGRRICSKCGANYHIVNRKPRIEGKCDKCNSDLIQRDDDKPEVVKQRLKVYKKQIEPLLDYYNNKNIVEELDGNKKASKVFLEVEKILEKRNLVR